MPISKIQRRLLAYLRKQPDASVPDIMAAFRFKSRNAVYFHVNKLEAAGLLVRPVVERTGWVVKG